MCEQGLPLSSIISITQLASKVHPNNLSIKTIVRDTLEKLLKEDRYCVLVVMLYFLIVVQLGESEEWFEEHSCGRF